MRFRNGRVLLRNGRLSPNCCIWRVTGYRLVILPDEPGNPCEYGRPGCPACETTPILEISKRYFNGTPPVVVEAAVSGAFDVNCRFNLNHEPTLNDNPLFEPCVSATVNWRDKVGVGDVCINAKEAEVSYEIEDCESARGSGNEQPLENRDLRIIFTLEAL